MTNNNSSNLKENQDINNLIIPFNPIAIIETYNLSMPSKKPIMSHETFGLACLSKEFLNFFNNSIEKLKLAEQLFITDKKYKVYTESIHLIKENFEPNETETAEDFSLEKKVIQEIKENNDQLKTILTQRFNYIAWVNEAKSVVKKNITHSSISKELREQWQDISLTASWTNKQLLFIAKEILPQLIESIDFAKDEIKRKRKKLPKALYKSYMAYFDNTLNSIKVIKKYVIASMYRRMSFFSCLNNYQNVLGVFIDKLVNKNIINKEYANKNKVMYRKEDEVFGKEKYTIILYPNEKDIKAIPFNTIGLIKTADHKIIAYWFKKGEIHQKQLEEGEIINFLEFPTKHSTQKLINDKKIVSQILALCGISRNNYVESFYRYIEKNGEKQEVEKLHKIACHDQDNLLGNTLIERKSGGIIIPSSLKNFIPKKEKWPRWLFKGNNFRYQFFATKLKEMMEVGKRLNPLAFTSHNLKNLQLFDITFSQLEYKDKQIQKWLNESSKEKDSFASTKFNQIFRKQTIDFLTQWESVLQESKTKIAHDKIKILKHLFFLIKQQYKDTDFSRASCDLLNRMIENLKKDKLEEVDKLQVFKIENDFREIKFDNELQKTIENCGQVDKPQDVQSFIDKVETLKAVDEFKQFAAKNQSQLLEGIDKLKFFIKEVRNKKTFHIDINVIINDYRIIYACANNELKQKMHNLVLKHFVFFLDKYLTNQLTESEIVGYKSLISTLGSDIYYSGKLLSEYIKDMNNISEIVLGKMRSVARQIANQFIDKRFNKELQLLDMKIKKIFNDKQLTQSQIKAIEEIFQEMLRDNQNIHAKLTSFKLSDKELLGIARADDDALYKKRNVKNLLDIRFLAHSSKKSIEQCNLTEDLRVRYEKKYKLINGLHEGLKSILSKDEVNKEISSIFFQTKPNGRLLFTKCYMDPAAIQAGIKNTNKPIENPSELNSLAYR